MKNITNLAISVSGSVDNPSIECKINENVVSANNLFDKLSAHSLETYLTFNGTSKFILLLTALAFGEIFFNLIGAGSSWWMWCIAIFLFFMFIGSLHEVNKIILSIVYADNDLAENALKVNNILNKVLPFYIVNSESDLEKRSHAGTSSEVETKQCSANKTGYFESESEFTCFRADDVSVCFLPGMFLVIDSAGKIEMGSYPKDKTYPLSITRGDDRILILKKDDAPINANVVGHTWLKVNNDGTPDRRFSENEELAKVRYSVINIVNGSNIVCHLCFFGRDQSDLLLNGLVLPKEGESQSIAKEQKNDNAIGSTQTTNITAQNSKSNTAQNTKINQLNKLKSAPNEEDTSKSKLLNKLKGSHDHE